ncbi:protein of unknown function [Methylocella tundrae]|uniref:Uncharacterized protein n=1 Tax=Methylocella tundrae TaxID=227605 RepID=A0A4U8YXG2_METTU|nr:protein of unknown function [Methylocella tundrae]
MRKAIPNCFRPAPSFTPMSKPERRGCASIRPTTGALSGSLEVTLSPLIPINEGVGEARALAPGGAALFVFDAPRAQTIGVGVRSDPDSAKVRLLDANGRSLGGRPGAIAPS